MLSKNARVRRLINVAYDAINRHRQTQFERTEQQRYALDRLWDKAAGAVPEQMQQMKNEIYLEEKAWIEAGKIVKRILMDAYPEQEANE